MESERSIIRILTELSSYSLEEFDDRLRLQKLVYLSKKMGNDLGYTFNWYARGPYSPSLTRVLFSAEEQNAFSRDSEELNETERRAVESLRAFLGDDVENPNQLELLASVWYFLRKPSYSIREREEIVQKIRHLKPQFTRTQILSAFTRIQQATR